MMHVPYNYYTYIDIVYLRIKDMLDKWNLEIYVIQMAQELYSPPGQLWQLI